MNISSLDYTFQRAKAMARTDDKLIQSVVENISQHFPDAKVQWDAGSGDTWVIIDCPKGNWALLNSTIPLLFVSPAFARVLTLDPSQIVVVAEEDINSRRYSITAETVLQTLNLIWPVNLVDPNQFSLADLSRATS